MTERMNVVPKHQGWTASERAGIVVGAALLLCDLALAGYALISWPMP